jgi:Spy/CpxP family protein refolding chaperone
VDLKVFSQQIKDQLSTLTVRHGGIFLFSLLMICGSTGLSEARQIDWGTLNLTPQQETQMEHLENNWQKTHQEVNSQIEKDMAEMKDILPTGDTQRIRLLQTRISTNKMYLMNESMDTFLKKRDMLSPSQRAQLQKMIPCKQQQAAP